jgi:hypothetical protein
MISFSLQNTTISAYGVGAGLVKLQGDIVAGRTRNLVDLIAQAQ